MVRGVRMAMKLGMLGLELGVAGAMQGQAPMTPHLLLDAKDFARLNVLAEAQPWAAAERKRLISQADGFPASYEKQFGLTGVELPPEGGSWYHLYVCPGTGTKMVFRSPNRSVCPDTGKVLTGFPYDQHVYDMRAGSLGDSAVRLGLAYRLTGKKSYAVAAAEILTKYAAKYLTYPIKDNKGNVNPKGARVYSQRLDESIWLINMAWAYDLVRDSEALNDDSRKEIEEKLLRPAAEICGHGPGSTYNIQSWQNAAVAAVGYTLGDKALIADAVDGPLGFRSQMKERVVDGFWIEGSWGYQFYALKALERTAQMAKRAGTDLWVEEPRLAALLESPVGLMFPDGTLPAFNDSEEDVVYKHKALYEVAYAETKKPLFAAIAGHGGRAKKVGSNGDDGGVSEEAFLFGVDELPAEAMPALGSRVFREAGYAVLRAPVGDLTEIMKFGPFGGAHGHFDELNEVNYANGEAMSVDPGTQLYGAPTHATWDKKTVAHNTMTVDEQTQKAATGRLLDWETTAEVTIASADAGDVYASAELKRTVVLTSDYVLDISSATSKDGAEHDYDWCYHNFGKGLLPANVTMTPYSGLAAGNGYVLLAPATTAKVMEDYKFGFQREDGKGMRVWLLGKGTTTEMLAGYAPGPNLKVKIPYVIARRHGKAAEFVAVMQPVPDAVTITHLTADGTTADGTAITVQSDKWTDVVTLGEKATFRRTMMH